MSARSQRATGWGYYADNVFWDTRTAQPAPARPRISAALLRESFEDYEYLFQSNNRQYPRPWTNEAADGTAVGVGFCPGSWLQDPSSMHALRHELGLKV